MTSYLASECLIIAIACAANALGINLLQLSKTILAGVLSFCTDVLAMTFYAIISAFALAALFLGLTAWSSLLFYQDSATSNDQTLAQALSRRWINHTWDVLHVTRPTGTSPLAFFLAIAIPALLWCSLVHQDRRSLIAREIEIAKQLCVRYRDGNLYPKTDLRAGRTNYAQRTRPSQAARAAGPLSPPISPGAR